MVCCAPLVGCASPFWVPDDPAQAALLAARAGCVATGAFDFWDDGSVESIEVSTYDAYGRLVLQDAGSPGTPTDWFSRATTTWDDEALRSRWTIDYGLDDWWEEAEDTAYDDRWNRVRSESYLEGNTTPYQELTCENTYSRKGLLSQDCFDPEPAGSTTNQLDRAGRVLRTHVETFDASIGWVTWYTHEGNEEVASETDGFSDGSIDQHLDFSYVDGRLVRTEQPDPDDAGELLWVRTYTWDCGPSGDR